VLRFNENVNWKLSKLTLEAADGRSAIQGQPVLKGSEAIVPLQTDAAGPLLLSWLVIGDDAHPVQGQFAFTVGEGQRNPVPSGLSMESASGQFTEGGVGGAGLGWAIKAGRSVEILLLYAVLGILLLRTLVLRRRLPVALAGGGPSGSGLFPDRDYRWLTRIGIASAVVVPGLFVLNVARVHQVVGSVTVSEVLFSSLGEVWAIKVLLWLVFVGVCVAAVRRPARFGDNDFLLLGVAVAATGAFVFTTHALSATPRVLFEFFMLGHLLLTAFWAGGLLALLLLVFPTRPPDEIWGAVGRFSTFMTVTVVGVIASGFPTLARLAGGWKGMWCSSFGITAGFKVMVVGIALAVGLVNNRLVAAHRRVRSPHARGRGARTIDSLRRLVLAEAAVLLTVLVLSAMLGETELPPVFKGRLLPGEAQELVQPGLFGTGCQKP
jgi:putative copper export protein